MKTEKANVQEKEVQETAVVPAPVIKKEVVLDEETIAAWKAEHGKIFKSNIDGVPFIWRKLKRKDYTAIMSIKTDLEGGTGLYTKQEEITRCCVLYPVNIDELIIENGGLATAISDEIMKKSGFDIEETTEL